MHVTALGIRAFSLSLRREAPSGTFIKIEELDYAPEYYCHFVSSSGLIKLMQVSMQCHVPGLWYLTAIFQLSFGSTKTVRTRRRRDIYAFLMHDAWEGCQEFGGCRLFLPQICADTTSFPRALTIAQASFDQLGQFRAAVCNKSFFFFLSAAFFTNEVPPRVGNRILNPAHERIFVSWDTYAMRLMKVSTNCGVSFCLLFTVFFIVHF
jgi:hypothetical protein